MYLDPILYELYQIMHAQPRQLYLAGPVYQCRPTESIMTPTPTNPLSPSPPPLPTPAIKIIYGY